MSNPNGLPDGLTAGIRPPDWIELAACKGHDPDTFFPEVGDNSGALAAKIVCSECPVRELCERHYINEHHGVFGGRTPKEREALRNGRGRPFQPPRWFSCTQCGRDVVTLNPNQILCDSDTCSAAWRRRYDRTQRKRPPRPRKKAS